MINPIETAPRDGTLLCLLVDYSGEDADHPLEDSEQAWTIGFNNFDDTGDDVWQFSGWSWTQDCFCEGQGKPIGWLPFQPAAGVMPTHRHRKRGSEYTLIAHGRMQSTHWRDPATPADNCEHGVSVNMREVAIYRSIDDGSFWVRPREEFEDGRFKSLAVKLSSSASRQPDEEAHHAIGANDE